MLTMISTTDYGGVTEKEPPAIDMILKEDNNHHRQLRFEDDDTPSFKKPSSKSAKDRDSSEKSKTRRRRRKESSKKSSSATTLEMIPSNNANNPETETSLSSWKPDSIQTDGERVLISLGSDRLSRSTALSSSMESSSPDKKSSGLSDGLAHSTHSDTTILSKLQNPEKVPLEKSQAKSLDHDYLSRTRAAMSRLRMASNDELEEDPAEEVISSGKKKVRRRHRDKNVKRVSKSSSKLRKDKQQQHKYIRDNDEVLMSSIEKNCAFPAASSDIFLSRDMDREYEVLRQKVAAATAARLSNINAAESDGEMLPPDGSKELEKAGARAPPLNEGENTESKVNGGDELLHRKVPNCAVIEIDSPKVVSVGKRASRKHHSSSGSRHKKKKSGISHSSSSRRRRHQATKGAEKDGGGGEESAVASVAKKETGVPESSSIPKQHHLPVTATTAATELDAKVVTSKSSRSSRKKKSDKKQSSGGGANDPQQGASSTIVTGGGGHLSALKPKITVVLKSAKNSLKGVAAGSGDTSIADADMRVHKEHHKSGSTAVYEDGVLKEAVKNGSSGKPHVHRRSKHHSRHSESLGAKSVKDRSSRKVPEKKLTSSDEGLPRSPTKGVDIETVPYDPPYSRLIKLDKEERNGKSHKSPAKKTRESRHRDYEEVKVKHGTSAKERVIVSNGKSEHAADSNKQRVVISQRSSKLPKIYKIRNMNFNDHMEVPSSRYYDTTTTIDKKSSAAATGGAARLTRAHGAASGKDNHSESKKYLRYHHRRSQVSSCSGTSYSSRSNDSVPSSGQSQSSRTHSDLSTSSESPERRPSRHRYHVDTNYNDRVSDHGISSLEKENYKKPSPTRYKKSTSSTACHRHKSNDDFKRSSRFHENGAREENGGRAPGGNTGKKQHKSGPQNGGAGEEEGFSSHLKLGYRRTRPSTHSVTAEGEDYAPRWQLHKLVVVSQTPDSSKDSKLSVKKQFQKQNSLGASDTRKEQSSAATSQFDAGSRNNEKKTVTIRDLYSLHNVLSDTRNGTVSS